MSLKDWHVKLRELGFRWNSNPVPTLSVWKHKEINHLYVRLRYPQGLIVLDFSHMHMQPYMILCNSPEELADNFHILTMSEAEAEKFIKKVTTEGKNLRISPENPN